VILRDWDFSELCGADLNPTRRRPSRCSGAELRLFQVVSSNHLTSKNLTWCLLCGPTSNFEGERPNTLFLRSFILLRLYDLRFPFYATDPIGDPTFVASSWASSPNPHGSLLLCSPSANVTFEVIGHPSFYPPLRFFGLLQVVVSQKPSFMTRFASWRCPFFPT